MSSIVYFLSLIKIDNKGINPLLPKMCVCIYIHTLLFDFLSQFFKIVIKSRKSNTQIPIVYI